MYHTASESHNELLGIYFDEYCDLSEARRKNMDFKYDPTNLTLSVCSYENWDKEKPDDSTVTNDKEKFYDSSPLQQGDKEVKGKKGLKIQTFICTNNSWKYFIQLKDEIRQILYLLHQYNKITRSLYNNLIEPL